MNFNEQVTLQPSGGVSLSTGKHDNVSFSAAGGNAFNGPPGTNQTIMDFGAGMNPRYERTDDSKTKHRYDNNGRLTSRSDRHGNTLTINRGPAGEITSVADWRGAPYTYQFDYHSTGRLKSITYPDGKKASLSYDSQDNLTEITLPSTGSNSSGSKVTLQYDQAPGLQNHLVSITDGAGRTRKEFSYLTSGPQFGSLSSISTAKGTRTLTRSAAGGGGTTTTAFDAATGKRLVDKTYNASGYLVQKTDYYDDDDGVEQSATTNVSYNSDDRWTTFSYSGSCLIAKRVDRTLNSRGNPLTYTRKSADTPNSSPSDIVTSLAYDASGDDLVSRTDPNGETTLFQYDSVGNRVLKREPVGSDASGTIYSEQSYEWNGKGQLVATVDPEGRRTEFSYHSSGPSVDMLDKISLDPQGENISTTVVQDPYWGGHSTTATAEGAQWSKTTNPLGRVEAISGPVGGIETTYELRRGRGP